MRHDLLTVAMLGIYYYRRARVPVSPSARSEVIQPVLIQPVLRNTSRNGASSAGGSACPLPPPLALPPALLYLPAQDAVTRTARKRNEVASKTPGWWVDEFVEVGSYHLEPGS